MKCSYEEEKTPPHFRMDILFCFIYIKNINKKIVVFFSRFADINLIIEYHFKLFS